ncbi:MAG: GNAT family N-acetyltransferase [Solirubrobacterales bacterium]|nr:GNAT family N-acetyltransferase [Solirubrobacterales bacterium]
MRYPQQSLTDGVIALRRWQRKDLGWVERHARDEAIERWSHLPQPFDAPAVAQWFETMGAAERNGTAMRLAIVDATTDERLGAIAVSAVDDTAATGELGFWLAATARGRGIAVRSVVLVRSYSFDRAGLHALIARVDVDNAASRALLERNGFFAAPDAGPAVSGSVWYRCRAQCDLADDLRLPNIKRP